MLIKPFLKWAGGKSQVLEDIRSKYPKELGVSILKYAEPFVGGGAVLFDVLSNYHLKEIYISDINNELILTYKIIRDNIEELIGVLKFLETKYLTANDELRKEIYYLNRQRFNNLLAIGNNSAELAALFIFLNKTCFNGLYRVNSKGFFNVPQGKYKKPLICDENNLRNVSNKLDGVNIICGDYKKANCFIDKKTFAYFDPPYRPLTATSNFTAYSTNGFNDKEQQELAQFIDKMNKRGAYIIASNSDPQNYSCQDDFFEKLYSQYNITKINACRSINSVSSSRGKITELLIYNG